MEGIKVRPAIPSTWARFRQTVSRRSFSELQAGFLLPLLLSRASSSFLFLKCSKLLWGMDRQTAQVHVQQYKTSQPQAPTPLLLWLSLTSQISESFSLRSGNGATCLVEVLLERWEVTLVMCLGQSQSFKCSIVAVISISQTSIFHPYIAHSIELQICSHQLKLVAKQNMAQFRPWSLVGLEDPPRNSRNEGSSQTESCSSSATPPCLCLRSLLVKWGLFAWFLLTHNVPNPVSSAAASNANLLISVQSFL